MSYHLRILAIDLGTSRVKVGLIDEKLVTVASSSHSYPTLTGEVGQAEQNPAEWLSAIHASVRTIIDSEPTEHIDVVVLTAQMPTLVALSASGLVMGNAITWQDSRADSLVEAQLDESARRRVKELAGTPIDGRYVIPMHVLRNSNESYEPATLLSAKDYLFYEFTGERVTDPSTASGFGNFDLASGGWSEELTSLWGITASLLPRVVDSHFTAPLSRSGATIVPGIAPGTPVMVGAADSVCAHHFINALFENSLSVIDGSSTVIMATINDAASFVEDVLVTPLVDATRRGAEMDLLATGSSIAWLANVLGLTAAQLEELAINHPRRSGNDVVFLPYLAGGEQGAIWRSDISGSINGLTLSASREDLALALYEGIAIETVRCIEVLRSTQNVTNVVSVAAPDSRHFGASLLASLLDVPVVALAQQSPSLVGAARIALEQMTDVTLGLESFDSSILGSLPRLELDYLASFKLKANRYLDMAAQPQTNPSRRDQA